MKRASDLINLPKQSEVSDLTEESILDSLGDSLTNNSDLVDEDSAEDIVIKLDPVEEQMNEIVFPETEADITEPVIDTNTSEFQEYMINDPEYVGYPSLEFQEQLYASVLYNSVDPSVPTSILDVGCGRGDLGHYIKTVIEPRFGAKVKYHGIDLSNLIIEIGKEKHAKLLSDQFKLENKLFDHTFQVENELYDWVIHCTNLTLPYQSITDYHEFFMRMVEVSLRNASKGAVFVILNDSIRTENYIHFSIGRLFDMLLAKEYQFAIDQSDFSEVTKIVVLSNQLNQL